MKSSKQQFRTIGNISVICFIIASSLVILESGAGKEYNSFIGWIGVLLIIWCGFSLKLINNTFFSLIFMFELSFYILTLGQSLLYALNIALNSTLDLYITNSSEIVNKAYIFTIMCFAAFHSGVLLVYRKHQKNRMSRKQEIRNSVDYTPTMRLIGWGVFYVSLLPYIFQMYQLLSIYRVSGYAIAYSSIAGSTSWSKIFNLVGSYFPFSLFMLLAAYRKETVKQLPIKIVVCCIVLLNFVLGNRSEPICYIIALLWFLKRNVNSNNEARKKTLLMVICCFLIVLIIPVIGETRNTGQLSFNTIIDSLIGKNSVWQSIIDTFIGMGWSAFPTIKTMELIPSTVSFHYGQSYFFAALALIPNLIGGTHISVKYAGLPLWLMTTLNMTFGPGYSMPAEAYYNFGWAGILVMPFFGFVIAKLLDERSKNETALRVFTMMGCFIILFTIPRREMLTALRNTVYYVGFLYWAVVLSAGRIQHKKEYREKIGNTNYEK